MILRFDAWPARRPLIAMRRVVEDLRHTRNAHADSPAYDSWQAASRVACLDYGRIASKLPPFRRFYPTEVSTVARYACAVGAAGCLVGTVAAVAIIGPLGLILLAGTLGFTVGGRGLGLMQVRALRHARSESQLAVPAGASNFLGYQTAFVRPYELQPPSVALQFVEPPSGAHDAGLLAGWSRDVCEDVANQVALSVASLADNEDPMQVRAALCAAFDLKWYDEFAPAAQAQRDAATLNITAATLARKFLYLVSNGRCCAHLVDKDGIRRISGNLRTKAAQPVVTRYAVGALQNAMVVLGPANLSESWTDADSSRWLKALNDPQGAQHIADEIAQRGGLDKADIGCVVIDGRRIAWESPNKWAASSVRRS